MDATKYQYIYEEFGWLEAAVSGENIEINEAVIERVLDRLQLKDRTGWSLEENNQKSITLSGCDPIYLGNLYSAVNDEIEVLITSYTQVNGRENIFKENEKNICVLKDRIVEYINSLVEVEPMIMIKDIAPLLDPYENFISRSKNEKANVLGYAGVLNINYHDVSFLYKNGEMELDYDWLPNGREERNYLLNDCKEYAKEFLLEILSQNKSLDRNRDFKEL